MPEWSKKKGCLVFGWITIAILVLIAIFVPAEKPVEGENVLAEEAAPRAAKPAPTSRILAEQKRDELMTVLRQASSATIGCTFAVEETIDLLARANEKPENLMQAYSRAHLGEPDCNDAVDDLGQIDRLKLATPVMTSNLDFALDECARAADLRAEALKTVKIALDGDYNFATAQKFKDAQQEARTTHNLCMGSLKKIGLESGLSADSLGFLDT